MIDIKKTAKYFSKHCFMIADEIAVSENCIIRGNENELFKLRCLLEVPEKNKWYRREKGDTVEVENTNGNSLIYEYRNAIASRQKRELQNTNLNDGKYQFFSVKGNYEYYPLDLALWKTQDLPEKIELDARGRFIIVDGIHIFATERCLVEPSGYLKEIDLYDEQETEEEYRPMQFARAEYSDEVRAVSELMDEQEDEKW